MALSLTFMVADRLPFARGMKVAEIVHWDFAARLLPQVLVWEKSPGSAPVNVMLLIVKAVGRLLVNVTFFVSHLPPAGCDP